MMGKKKGGTSGMLRMIWVKDITKEYKDRRRTSQVFRRTLIFFFSNFERNDVRGELDKN